MPGMPPHMSATMLTMAPPLRFIALGKDFPGHQKAASQVGAHHGFPAFLADGRQRGGELAAGIVDQAVDNLHGLVDVGHGVFHRFFIPDVTGKADGLTAIFLDFRSDRVELFLLATDQHHAGAQGGQLVGGTAADTGATAGDDDVFCRQTGRV